MRESFSLRILWKYRCPLTKKRKIFTLKYFAKYFGVPVWKMVLKDTWYDFTN